MKKERYFDSRVVETYIARGIVSREEYDAYLASLEDCAELSSQTESQMLASARSDGDS